MYVIFLSQTPPLSSFLLIHLMYFIVPFCFVLSFVTKQLVARGVKVAVGAVGGAPPPAAPATQPSDSTPQEDASKATPSSRPTTPAISMTAALKDVGAVSHHHTD